MTSSIPTTTDPQVRAFTFSELAAIQPGFIFGGLVHVDGTWKLGPDWNLLETDYHPRRKGILVQYLLSEHKVKWRQRLRPYAKEVNGSRFYNPPMEEVSKTAGNLGNTIKVGFNTVAPVGMYLGHIVRTEGTTRVNVLIFEGYDVWL